MAKDLTVGNLQSALEELGKQMVPLVNLNTMQVTACKDQNGVVWMGPGFMDKKAYEALLQRAISEGITGLPTYDELPLWDNHSQNIVEVD